ncbi:hypothetical protein [Microbispora catharanthi]|nr:hypothetical protein [Microbispora catharanthi]
MLKFSELEARFPRREDIPRVAMDFMAVQVTVEGGAAGAGAASLGLR